MAEPKRTETGSQATVKGSAIAVLLTADPDAKAAAARGLYRQFSDGELSFEDDGLAVPDRPARPVRPELLPPSQMPARRRAGSEKVRFALLHALAHSEFNAIDLAVDIVARFGNSIPPKFMSDWLQVADEEAEHFTMAAELLKLSGSSYGDLPAHDGLWESAKKRPMIWPHGSLPCLWFWKHGALM